MNLTARRFSATTRTEKDAADFTTCIEQMINEFSTFIEDTIRVKKIFMPFVDELCDHNNRLQKIYLYNVSDKLSANHLTFLCTYAIMMMRTYKKWAAKRSQKNEVRTSKSADYESNMNKTELFELIFHCNCKILYIFYLV